jgi:hypothetical protein
MRYHKIFISNIKTELDKINKAKTEKCLPQITNCVFMHFSPFIPQPYFSRYSLDVVRVSSMKIKEPTSL